MIKQLKNLSFSSHKDFEVLREYLLSSNHQVAYVVLQRSISNKLITIIKKWRVIQEERQIDEILTQILNIIYTNIQGLPSKESRYPYFLFLLRQYQKISGKALEMTNKQKMKGEVKIRNGQIISDEYKNISLQLKKEEYYKNNFQGNADIIPQITERDVELPNYSCLNCSRIFYRNWKTTLLYNSESIIWLSKKEGKKVETLKKYICSLLNSKGGIILIGADQKQKYIDGISMNKAQAIKKLIYQTIETLKPKDCLQKYFQMTKVPVLQNIEEGLSNKYILRVLIKPNYQKVVYIQNKKGTMEFFQLYQLLNNQPKKVQGQQIYSLILQKFQNIKRVKYQGVNIDRNYHYGSPCKTPLQIKQTMSDSSDSSVSEIENSPVIKYQHQSVIIVPSAKKENLIQVVLEELQKNKIKDFSIMKPYTQFSKESSRSIWLFCHHEKFETVEKLVKKIDLRLLPLYLKIQLNTTVFKEKDLLKVRKKAEKLIKKKIPEVKKQKQDKKAKQLYYKWSFETLQQSLLYFCLLQNENVRPNFKK